MHADLCSVFAQGIVCDGVCVSENVMVCALVCPGEDVSLRARACHYLNLILLFDQSRCFSVIEFDATCMFFGECWVEKC